jgi:TolB protein
MIRLGSFAGLLALGAMPLLSQDTTARGVRIGLSYDPGVHPAVIVLPVPGPHGDSIRAIMQRDLDFGDRVTILLAPDSVLAAITSTANASGQSTGLDYGAFKTLGALAVVQASMTPRGLHVAVHDVARTQVIQVNEFPLAVDPPSREWRLGVHIASDSVEGWITGVRGIAATRVAYIRGHAVRVVDSDGADETTIPMVGEGMSPAWSPTGRALTYATYGVDSRIVMYDLRTSQSRAFGEDRNVNNNSPVFSPDGSNIVYSATGQDGTDIYSVPVTVGAARRLSVGRGADNLQPSFSPDGRRIAFMSSRAGQPEIYTMDADGTSPDMLTTYDFGPKNYRTSPDWSPDGRQIAYEAYAPESSKVFQVFTMTLADHTPRQLTSDGENEDPSWAPDARHLVFTSSRTGTKQLWVLDTETGRARQLTHVDDARLAAWSPRLVP